MPSEVAWIYCTVSSKEQADTIEDQVTWAQEVAGERRWPIARIFQGVATGKLGVRKILDDLLVELRHTPNIERPHRILMIRIDRVGRGDALGVIAALHAIYEMGVILHTREDGDLVIDSASSAMKPILRALTGGVENEARKDKATASSRRKKRAGEWVGKQPYGFVCVERRLVVYEPEAAVIRGLYERKLKGWGKERLARWMAQAAPRKTSAAGSPLELQWANSTIRYILRNPIYRGVIVSEEVWDVANATRGRRWVKRESFALRGALKCTCGRTLYGRVQARRGAAYRYYCCRATVHPKEVFHHASDLERAFVEILNLLMADPGLIVPAQNDNTEALLTRKRELRGELDGLERRKERAWALAEDGTVPKAELTKRLDALNATAIELKEALATIDGELAVARAMTRAHESAAQIIAEAAQIWNRIESADEASEIARTVAELVGGLRVSPDSPGRIIGF